MDEGPPTPPTSSVRSDDHHQVRQHETPSPSSTSQLSKLKSFRLPPQLTPEQRAAALEESSPSQPRDDDNDHEDGNPYKPAYHDRLDPASRIAKLRSQKRSNPPKPLGRRKRLGAKHATSNFDQLGASEALTKGRKRSAPSERPEYAATSRRNEALQQLFAGQVQVTDVSRKDFDDACFTFNGPHGRAMATRKDEQDQDLKWHLRGMKKSSLLPHHQLLGAAFLRAREIGSSAPQGGLLADEMGLGKTIQMLVNILGSNIRRQREAKDGDGPMEKEMTLIVAPNLQVRKQWREEIEMHFEDGIFGKVLDYSHNKAISSDMDSVLREHDIVLTTYKEVLKSFPNDSDKRGDLNGDEEDKARYFEWAKQFQRKVGTLHRMPFDRVVLDESHKIKMHNIRTTKACRALHGKYRWLISGSPFINDALLEVYSFFRFLRVPGIPKLARFKKQYNSEANAIELQDKVGTLMLRRTHDTRIFDKPIVDLPDSYREIVWVHATGPEAKIHKTMQDHLIEEIKNIMLREKHEGERRAKILAATVPVRLMTSHFLIACHALLKYTSYDNLVDLFHSSALIPLTQSQLQRTYKYMAKVASRAEKNLKKIAAHNKLHPKAKARDDADEEALDSPPRKVKVELPHQKIDTRFNLKKYIKRGGQMMLSAKIRAAMAKIEEWLASYPDEKIIVFSMFLGSLDIIGALCEARGIGAKHYTGKQSAEAKDKARKAWATRPEIPVLLTSFKSGGEGLNLTQGSSVLIVDLWWNAAAEDQAFARVFRIGQDKCTRLARLVLANSIDERLLEKQAEKSKRIGFLMSKTERASQKWTAHDLASLFGLRETDYNGERPHKRRATTGGRGRRSGSADDHEISSGSSSSEYNDSESSDLGSDDEFFHESMKQPAEEDASEEDESHENDEEDHQEASEYEDRSQDDDDSEASDADTASGRVSTVGHNQPPDRHQSNLSTPRPGPFEMNDEGDVMPDNGYAGDDESFDADGGGYVAIEDILGLDAAHGSPAATEPSQDKDSSAGHNNSSLFVNDNHDSNQDHGVADQHNTATTAPARSEQDQEVTAAGPEPSLTIRSLQSVDMDAPTAEIGPVVSTPSANHQVTASTSSQDGENYDGPHNTQTAGACTDVQGI